MSDARGWPRLGSGGQQQRTEAGAVQLLPHGADAGLARLPLLQAVVWETLRLYPPAPLVARECVKDVVLEDGAGPAIAVRAGTTVIIPIARDRKSVV